VQEQPHRRSLPLLIGTIFFLVDLLWIGGLWVFGSVLSEWDLNMVLTQVWNTVHTPARLVLEPILFPAAMTHSLSPPWAIWWLYFVGCAVQSLLVGMMCGYIAEGGPFLRSDLGVR
jgi:hypothetical protein